MPRIACKISVLICLCLLIHSNALAQETPTEKKIDSLQAIYKSELNSNPEKAKKAAREWLKLSKQSDASLNEAKAYYALGNLGSITGDYNATIANISKAIEILKKLDFEQGLPACYNILALGYKNTGNYPKAMDNFMLCIDYSKKSDNKQQQANAYQNIATLYILQKDYKKASENLDRAANLYRALGDDDGVLITLFNFANIMKEQGRYPEAYKHYQTVLKYREREGNKAAIAYIKINLSQLLVVQKKYKEAIPELKKTLALLEQLNFTSDMAIVLNDLGLCEMKLNNTQQAINYFQRALDISEEKSLLSYNANFYKNLAQLYEEQQDYKNALLYYQKGISTEHEINSVDKEKYVAGLQERYETELKETRIALLEKEQKLNETELQKAELTVKRQTILRNAFVAGFILVLITLIILRYFYVLRLRVQKQLVVQKEENAKQEINQLIKDHKISVIERFQEGQDEERARLAREIHDGIGSDLAGIKIAFEHYAGDKKDNPQIKRMLQSIDNACRDLRSLSHQLHPLPFSKIGFASFLRDFLGQLSLRSGLKITAFFYPEEEIDNLPDDLLADAYRIVQELVNNILKHANATTAEVQLTKHEDYLNIVINDNGTGFTKNKKQGIGLRNISERIEKVHGTIDIDSSANSGTSITINIPIKQ
ncbi:tetratricopeptide repeat protein [Flavobacterium beibuense]|uniref:tetratricopeptide repeat-containing sensor histidine kinase n=1 Tax=Flavobacterium beibuense TaxID=657326 RepID=UPI003A920318